MKPRGGLRRHYEKHHNVTVWKKKRQHVCRTSPCYEDGTFFGYYFYEGYRRHDIRVHQESHFKHKCKYCEYVFVSESGLEYHFNQCHKEDEMYSYQMKF